MPNPGSTIRQPKARGEWAELRFMTRVAELGLRVTKPWGDNAPYDLAVESHGHFLRVQVKCTLYKRGHSYVCTVCSSHVLYRPDELDFFAAYVIPADVWYILPLAATNRQPTVVLSPHLKKSKYKRYEEAWHLLKRGAALPALRTQPTNLKKLCHSDTRAQRTRMNLLSHFSFHSPEVYKGRAREGVHGYAVDPFFERVVHTAAEAPTCQANQLTRRLSDRSSNFSSRVRISMCGKSHGRLTPSAFSQPPYNGRPPTPASSVPKNPSWISNIKRKTERRPFRTSANVGGDQRGKESSRLKS